MTPLTIAGLVWRGRALVAAAVVGVFALVGYLAAINLARPLGVSVADLGFDRSAYVLFVSAYIAFGLAWAATLAIAAFLTVVAVDEWEPRIGIRVAVLFIAVGAAVIGFWRADEWLSGWWFLLISCLGLAAAGVVGGLVASWPGDDVRFRRGWIAFALIAVPAVFVPWQLNRLSLEGGELAQYALSVAHGQPAERPFTALSLIAEPTRGLVSYGDVTDRCVVRVTDRVYLTVSQDGEPVRTLVVVPDLFVSAPDC